MYMGMAFLNTDVCRKAAGCRFPVWLRTASRMKPYDKEESVFHVLKTIQQDSSIALLLKKVIMDIMRAVSKEQKIQDKKDLK